MAARLCKCGHSEYIHAPSGSGSWTNGACHYHGPELKRCACAAFEREETP